MPMTAYSPSGPKKSGQRRKMPDANGIGLRLDDRRHADAGEQRGAGRALDERAA